MNGKNELVNPQLHQTKPGHWQAFTYLSDSSPVNSLEQSEQVSLEEIQNPEVSLKSFSLATAKVGDRICIISLNCGEANNRLVGMGLIPGAILEVMSCTLAGSVIVALQDQRLGLGAEMARLIQVMDAEEGFGVEFGSNNRKEGNHANAF